MKSCIWTTALGNIKNPLKIKDFLLQMQHVCWQFAEVQLINSKAQLLSQHRREVLEMFRLRITRRQIQSADEDSVADLKAAEQLQNRPQGEMFSVDKIKRL